MSDSDFADDYDIESLTNEAIQTVVPAKSKQAYELAYKIFEEWFKTKQITTIDENVMLAYFNVKSSQYKPNTLWCDYSKLRTMIYLNTKVDISSFQKLIGFLKRQSEGYMPTRSKTFTREEMDRFFWDADDEKFLLMKTALIIGVAGACRRKELTNLSMKDVTDYGNVIVVDIKKTKTYVDRQFVIDEGVVEDVNLLEIIRKYLSLRTKITTTDRFFVRYRAGECISMPVGINTIGSFPKKIAEFLSLPNRAEYKGHCFRATSAKLLVDPDAGFTALEQQISSETDPLAVDTVSTFASAQEISVGSTQVSQNDQMTHGSQSINFMEMADHNFQGCNMITYTINFNVGKKRRKDRNKSDVNTKNLLE